MIIAAHILTHASGILNMYHIDGISHGCERGPLGITAQQQLVVRIPER